MNLHLFYDTCKCKHNVQHQEQYLAHPWKEFGLNRTKKSSDWIHAWLGLFKLTEKKNVGTYLHVSNSLIPHACVTFLMLKLSYTSWLMSNKFYIASYKMRCQSKVKHCKKKKRVRTHLTLWDVGCEYSYIPWYIATIATCIWGFVMLIDE